MLRSTITHSLPAAFTRASAPKITSNAARFTSLAFKKHNASAITQIPCAVVTSQLRWSTSDCSVKPGAPQLDKIDKEAEKKLAQQKLEPNPDVSVTSTIAHTIFEPAPEEAGVPDVEVFGALKSDFVGLQEFSLWCCIATTSIR